MNNINEDVATYVPVHNGAHLGIPYHTGIELVHNTGDFTKY